MIKSKKRRNEKKRSKTKKSKDIFERTIQAEVDIVCLPGDEQLPQPIRSLPKQYYPTMSWKKPNSQGAWWKGKYDRSGKKVKSMKKSMTKSMKMSRKKSDNGKRQWHRCQQEDTARVDIDCSLDILQPGLLADQLDAFRASCPFINRIVPEDPDTLELVVVENTCVATSRRYLVSQSAREEYMKKLRAQLDFRKRSWLKGNEQPQITQGGAVTEAITEESYFFCSRRRFCCSYHADYL